MTTNEGGRVSSDAQPTALTVGALRKALRGHGPDVPIVLLTHMKCRVAIGAYIDETDSWFLIEAGKRIPVTETE